MAGLGRSWLAAWVNDQDRTVRRKGHGQANRARRLAKGSPRLALPPDELFRTVMIECEFGVDDAAGVVGLSKRTLQRRLAQSGFKFSQLLDDMRFAHALILIEGPSIRLADVARCLGYSDAANFARAFRRWTGLSPSAYRQLDSERRS